MISDLLLLEFEEEVKKTRTMLERVPMKEDFQPHAKSMPLGKLAPHVAEFYMAFGLKVLQGYGLTETTAASSLNHPDRIKYWTVGEPMHGVEIKMASDGEILIRQKPRSRKVGRISVVTA